VRTFCKRRAGLSAVCQRQLGFLVVISLEADKRGIESVHTASGGEVVGKSDDRARHMVSVNKRTLRYKNKSFTVCRCLILSAAIVMC